MCRLMAIVRFGIQTRKKQQPTNQPTSQPTYLRIRSLWNRVEKLTIDTTASLVSSITSLWNSWTVNTTQTTNKKQEAWREKNEQIEMYFNLKIVMLMEMGAHVCEYYEATLAARVWTKTLRNWKKWISRKREKRATKIYRFTNFFSVKCLAIKYNDVLIHWHGHRQRTIKNMFQIVSNNNNNNRLWRAWYWMDAYSCLVLNEYCYSDN